MQLRPLQSEDAAAIAELWHAGATDSASADASFAPRVSPEEFAAIVAGDLTRGDYMGWGIFADTPPRLLAYLTAQISAPSPEFSQAKFLYVLDLDVHGDARRQGLGAKLVAAAKAHASAEGAANVEVSWLSADTRASAFWRSQGFDQYVARARCQVVTDKP